MLLAALRAPAAAPSPLAIDGSRAMQQLPALDIDRDGSITRADARRLERTARSLRWHGIGRPGVEAPRQAAAGQGLLGRVLVGPNGRVVTADLSRVEKAEAVRQLRWAASQARIAAALDATPATSSTLAGALPVRMGATTTGRGLVDAIATIDSSSLGRMAAAGVRPVATFDYDGTSAEGDVLVPVLRALASAGMLRSPDGDPFAALASRIDVLLDGAAGASATARARSAPSSDANASALHVTGRLPELFARPELEQQRRELVSEVFFATAASMEGVPVADARRLVRRLARHGDEALGIPPLRSLVHDPSDAPGDSMRDIVGALRSKDIEPWVVTYGFDWIATEVVPMSLGIPARNIVAWPAETRWGRFTGSVPRELDKHHMVRDAIGVPPVIVFGDSGSDVPMLDMALARGMIVNPGRELRERNARRTPRWSELDMRA